MPFMYVCKCKCIKVTGLIYKTAPVLIEMQPEETITMWLQKTQNSSRSGYTSRYY